MTSRRVTYMGYGACALAGCLWGTGFYFGRLALNEMSVEYMVLYRFLFASLGMLPVALTQRVRLTRSSWDTARFSCIRHSCAVPAPVPRTRTDHGEPRLADGGVDACAAGAGRSHVCRRAAGLAWLGWRCAGSTVGVGLDRAWGQPRSCSPGRTPSLAGDLLVVASLVTALAWILLNKKLMLTHSPPW